MNKKSGFTPKRCLLTLNGARTVLFKLHRVVLRAAAEYPSRRGVRHEYMRALRVRTATGGAVIGGGCGAVHAARTTGRRGGAGARRLARGILREAARLRFQPEP